MGYETILWSLLSASAYSLLIFAKKQDQDFDIIKYLSTVIVGLFVGITLVGMNSSITQATVESQLALLGGMTVGVESILKAIYRKWLA